jgi:hypothetical protein
MACHESNRDFRSSGLKPIPVVLFECFPDRCALDASSLPGQPFPPISTERTECFFCLFAFGFIPLAEKKRQHSVCESKGHETLYLAIRPRSDAQLATGAVRKPASGKTEKKIA